MTATGMQTALTRTVFTNAPLKRGTLVMDTYVQVHLIFIIQYDHRCDFPLTVLVNLYAKSCHKSECSNKAIH